MPMPRRAPLDQPTQASAAVPVAQPASRPLSLGVLSDVLGYHVAQAAVTTVDMFERHIGQPFGLRKVEFSLLLLLLANGPLTPKRLGHALALSGPNLTLLLDRLQDRGLLRRERSATDQHDPDPYGHKRKASCVHSAVVPACRGELSVDAGKEALPVRSV